MEELKQIESALNIAANRGCFNLQDSAFLFSALKKIESELAGGVKKQAESIPGGGIKKPDTDKNASIPGGGIKKPDTDKNASIPGGGIKKPKP